MKLKKIMAFLLLTTIFSMSFTAYAQDTSVEDTAAQQQEVIEYSNYMLKNMVKVYAHNIADNYYYGINDDELLFSIICNTIEEGKFDINKSLEAMIKALKDDYAEFYTPEQYKALTEDIAGEFSGIGATITQNDNGILVLEVFDQSPALKAGIMEGDYITAINGVSVEGMNSAQVRNLIVGKTDSEVSVTLRRGTSVVDVVCVRATVQVSHIKTKMLTDDIAYLKLVQFSKNAPEDIAAYVKEIQGKNVKKLVLDLRDNPGGDLEAALEIANIFISTGRIGELRYKDRTEYLRATNFNAPRMELAVLVNENSASASELLSMAFQGRSAAKLIGTKTYGKGSMQILTRAVTGAGIKYTIGEFYTAKGKRVHTVGITPDIIVENEYIPVDEEKFAKIDYDRIEEGTKGGDMTLALEQRLEALGYMEEADEVYDQATADAVMRFQAVLGHELTGVPGFYEYLYLNDYSYDFDVVIDKQLDAAVEYLK